MLIRAVTAFVALPGMVGFALPVLIGAASHRPVRSVGLAGLILCLGTTLLLSCVREFYVAGRGTLAPWDPPKHLVTTGPYRVTRNPMYVGVLTIIAGWCVLWEATALIIYAVVVLVGFQARVVLAEEPWAARQFGSQWQAYRAKVPRWLFQ